MKRSIFFILSLTMILMIFVSCSKSDKKNNDTQTTVTQTTQTANTTENETTTQREIITLAPTTEQSITDSNGNVTAPKITVSPNRKLIEEATDYFSKDDVAKYISLYKKLPQNYVTPSDFLIASAKLGSTEEALKVYAVGGDKFDNTNKQLPFKRGRLYFTCDVNTQNKKDRGTERLVYSNDGIVFYTNDDYKTLTQLY